MTIDLERYLARIAYGGPRTPTLPVLSDLVRHHVAAIPFENLSPFLDQPVPLDVEALHAKLVDGGRGGYCFEQNRLFQVALEALGFAVVPLAARVVWGQSEDAITPRSHMLLRVDVDRPYVVDVGFGGLTPTAPLRLEVDTEQKTPHEVFRLRARGRDFALQARVGDEWQTTYRFDLNPQYPVDFEVANHYVATHPDSHFRHGLTIARAVPGRRDALRNRQLTTRPLDGPSDRRTLRDPDDLRATLEGTFGLTLPADVDLATVFARLR